MPEIDGALTGRDGRSPRLGDAAIAPQLYGALDLGTNNCRLLIARPTRDGFRVVDSFSRIVRLGEGISRSGRLTDDAMDRAYDALSICAERVAKKNLPSERIAAVATQACRAAENGPEFIERVRVGTGLRLRIITPDEEARLSVEGCRNLLDSSAQAVLVVDVGGGSTELSWLVRADQGFETVGWMSAPVGVVTLAERHPETPDDPLSHRLPPEPPPAIRPPDAAPPEPPSETSPNTSPPRTTTVTASRAGERSGHCHTAR